MKIKILNFFNGLCKNSRFVNLVWYLLPLAAIAIKALSGKPINNFLIYKGVFYHTVAQVNLYDLYPSEYFDRNHYGILFSLIIAPFCFLPPILSVVLYQGAQLLGLHLIIRKLPITMVRQNAMMLFLLVENITHAQNSQTNIFIAFVLLGAWVYIYSKKNASAAIFIMVGFFVKLYGIVGLGLFFFVRYKIRFIAWLLLSFIILFYLPIIITDVDFIHQSYIDWWTELKDKNISNIDLSNIHQNLSMIGFITRCLKLETISNLWIILPAFVLQLLPLLRWRLWQNTVFQLHYLSSLMLFIVLFNTATESSTYVIGACGVALWWVTSVKPLITQVVLLVLGVFIFGTLSTTDLVPKSLNHGFFRLYAVKALPYFLVWVHIIKNLSLSLFDSKNLVNG